ncbi:30S ribosomal protein S4P [Methanocella paludicola SANAE]|uniref:Small ribosomal subunit protein uS4 n=1 Tax=Methanocella paludicola (strain DSM 17711 / JCM 13418 / NBRC 101707 / SANAE) TaxID=304371 RepID=D1Z0V6_METPS|nr:30S ribosomal protein S4 [Methanocella paludicola]BAI62328.1 30S ribosomal protein S4P [Methanocella paludicola SANAE]
MGYPGKAKKIYNTPHHPWQKARIDEETALVKKYGLRNKKNVWKFASMLRKYRGQARTLLGVLGTGLATEDSHYAREAGQIQAKLQKLGVLKEDSKLEDILALKVEDLLERQLQTIVFRKGYANSMKQARQFIVHGHVSLNGRKITVPSYMVLKAEEDTISYYIGSPITKDALTAKPVVKAPAPKVPAPAATTAAVETAQPAAQPPKEA